MSEKVDDAVAAAEEVVAAIRGKLTLGRRSVGIVLVGIEVDREAFTAAVRSALDIPLIGCTTYGEATDAGYTETSASLMVLTADDVEFGLGIGEGLVERGKAAVDDAWAMAAKQISEPPKLVIAFPDGALSARGELVAEALAAKTAVPVMGGCPGDGGGFKQTFQVFRDRVLTDSVPLLLIAGDISPVVVTRTGWQPMGARGVATKVDGVKIVEIDHKPAVEFLGRYISDLDDPEVIGTFPIAIYTDAASESSNGRFVLRSPFFYDKTTGAVTYGGLIPEGCTVQLGRAYRDRVIESSSAAATAVMAKLDKPPAAILFASCGARRLVLGAKVEGEVKALGEVFGPVPIAGFYSYGELGPFDSTEADSRARYHNCTLVICAL